MQHLFMALTALALSGCANINSPLDDGYQFGDLTATPFALQRQYCETADPKLRAVRMVLLQRAGVPLPDDGACTDIIEVLSD